jgi:putative peptidoglycan lipid II flippase
VVLVELVPARLVVAAIAAASTVGLLAVGVPMMIAVGRIRGTAATQGIGRAAVAGLAAAIAGAAFGVAAAQAMPAGGKLYDGAAGAVGVATAMVSYIVAAYFFDRKDLRMAIAGIVRFVRSRRRRETG